MVHELIADWAAAHPRIRRVWIAGADRLGCELISLELEPVADSCKWRAELEVRLGRPVSMAWLDPDAAWREPLEELVYESVNAYPGASRSTPIIPASS